MKTCNQVVKSQQTRVVAEMNLWRDGKITKVHAPRISEEESKKLSRNMLEAIRASNNEFKLIAE
ncbi:Uncharacterised protein [Yersinia nurmii]|uniref:Uncharacterized protein n=1 Tax=Yersinia nurmii TaxID=685706 RepID=A0ABP1YJX2_9GAMM|nr:hypothetical protein [Yersinia nurmii]CNF28683.1 Uncharacterised protein [Yersinia nurmii]